MTFQIRERLIVNVETEMLSCPPLPEKHPRIIEPEGEWRSSDNVRGYVGTWEIKRNGRFYLRALGGAFELTRGKPLFADWVTGVIRIPMGDDVLKYSFGGLTALYWDLTALHAVEIHVEIKQGEVIGVRKPEAIQGHLLHTDEGGFRIEPCSYVREPRNKIDSDPPVEPDFSHERGRSLDEQMTAQTRERLIVNVETEMLSCPPLPEKHPRIIEREVEWRSSANVRGYVGTWEIKNDRFYLRALGGEFELTRGKPLFADWVTGVIRIPMGEILKISPGMLAALHEVEIHVEIEQGMVVGSRTVDNRGKKPEDIQGDLVGLAFEFLQGKE
jgi:hypothetical protein